MANTSAKSRFEIVNDLTEKKTGIVQEIAQLRDNIVSDKNNIERAKREYIRSCQQAEREHNDNIEDLEANLKSYEASVSETIKSFETKIKAYDDAIEAIKAISDTKE